MSDDGRARAPAAERLQSGSTAAGEQVSAATQESTASTHEIAGSAERLKGSAYELEQLVARFRLVR